MKMAYYLVASACPLDREPLPEPLVVATITVDPRFTANLNPYRELQAVAAKMGLFDFEITTADSRDLPGHQMGLPFPVKRR